MRGTFLLQHQWSSFSLPFFSSPPSFLFSPPLIPFFPSFLFLGFQHPYRKWCVPETSAPVIPLTHVNTFFRLLWYQVLGSGYLVLEILLPLLLIGLLAGSILPPLLRIVWSVLLMGLAVIYRVVDYLADDILEPLLKAIFTRD